MKKLRCSSLPRFWACPESAKKPNININSSGKPAEIGTAVHWCMEQYINDSDVKETIKKAIQKFNVEEKEISFLVYNGIKIWEKISVDFEDVKTEAFLSGQYFDGTADITAIKGDEIITVDWKSGFLEANCKEQIQAYNTMAMMNSNLKNGVGYAIFIRTGNFKRYEFTLKENLDFIKELELKLKSSYYNVGEHCTYCKRQHECEAIKTQSKGVIELFRGNEVKTYTPLELASIRDDVKVVEKACKDYDKLLRLALESEVEIKTDKGVYSLDEEKRVNVKNSSKKTIEDYGINFDDVTKVNKALLKKDVMSKADRGVKKAEWEMFEKVLRDGGHLEESIVKKIKIKAIDNIK